MTIKTPPYILGDRRTIGVSYSWNPQDGIWQYKDGPLPGMIILAKGDVHETFYVDNRGVWRAEDTSYNDHEFYWLRDKGQPASLWIPAEIGDGAYFLREPMVTVYRKSDGGEVSSKPHRTWIRATQRSTWTSAKGKTFTDILWVEVFDGDAKKAANDPWEIYVFALGIGMVGWMELAGGHVIKHSDANHVWPAGAADTPVLSVSPLPGGLRYEPLKPSSAPPAGAPGKKGNGVSGVLYTGDYVNMRPGPDVSREPAVAIYNGTSLVWYPESEATSADGRKWVWVEVGARSGWMSLVHTSWASQFAPLTPSVVIKPSVSHDIPWVSQLGADAPDANDCGQTAAVGALHAVGAITQRNDQRSVTPDQFNDHLGNKQTGANVSDLIAGLGRYGVTARAFRATTANIKRELSAGNYPIVVVQRGRIPLLMQYNEFAEAHWLGVRGYDASSFTLVDALVTNGRDLEVDDTTLTNALSSSTWNGTTQSGWIGISVEMPQVAAPPVVEPPVIPPVVTPPMPGFEIEFSTMDEKRVLAKGLKDIAERIDAAPGRFVVINVNVKE